MKRSDGYNRVSAVGSSTERLHAEAKPGWDNRMNKEFKRASCIGVLCRCNSWRYFDVSN